MMELESIMKSLGVVEGPLLKAELHRLMKRAAAGQCTYGSAAEGRQVEQMTVAPTILEMRLGWYTGEDEEQVLVRLYFTEPDHMPGALCAAKIAIKRPGPMATVEQSGHAREAAARVDRALGGYPLP